MNLYIEGLTLGNVSISGDQGQPNVKLVGPSSTTLAVEEALSNELFCTSCSTLIGNSKIRVRIGDSTGKILTAAKMLSLKSGTMFDMDDDGVVDAAENMDLLSATAITDADSPYTVLADDTLVECDVSGGIIGITLPAGIDGQTYMFKDTEGSAGTNNITITPDGTETIEGAATYVLNIDYSGVQMYYDETSADWKILNASGVSPAAVAANTTHRTSSGVDHTYIDQDVTTTSSPIFAVTNMTGSAADLDSNAVHDADFAGATLGRMTRTGVGTYAVIQDNLAAAVAPAVGDDDTAGYGVGSLWIDTTADTAYVCVDAGTGAAVWRVIDLTAHEALTTAVHGKVSGINAAVDMAPGGAPVNNALALDGAAANQFVPKELVFVCTAGAALNGDVTVSVGTTPGGAEIMAATPLTGLNAAGLIFRIALTGLMPDIAGNAAMDCTVTIADTGGGATGTMTAMIIGDEV
jgi:hypothetical protein